MCDLGRCSARRKICMLIRSLGEASGHFGGYQLELVVEQRAGIEQDGFLVDAGDNRRLALLL